MADVIDAQGICVFIKNAAGDTDIEIMQVASFEGFDGEATDIEVTNFKSTAKEFRQGLRDFGNVSFEVQRDDNDPGQAELKSANALQAVREFTILLANGDTYIFDAYVKSFSASGAVDDILRGTVNLKVTGEVVFTDN